MDLKSAIVGSYRAYGYLCSSIIDVSRQASQVTTKRSLKALSMFTSMQTGKGWRRSLVVVASIALIAAYGLAAQTTKPTERSQVLHSVFSNPTPISIADAPVSNTPPGIGSLYASPINVSGQGDYLVHLQVTLNNVNHAFPDDLDVLLVGPGGQSFVLQSDAGGNTSVVNRTYTFDDVGLTQLPNDGGITPGTYKPANHQGNDGANDVFPAPAPTGPYGNPGPQASGNATLDGVFVGTDPNGTWSLFVTDDENLDAGNINGGWSIAINSIVIEPPVLAGVLDFDGDGKSDMTVVRIAGGSATWYINRSTQGFYAQGWGAPGDVFVPLDYDGDGKCDIAVYRGGTWYIFQSSSGTLNVINFGIAGDDPTVVDDYDGDGKADPAVVRNGGGLKTWYVLGSATGFSFRQWGLSTDTPVPGDFDGDGKADFAVKRGDQPILGAATFYIDRTTSGFESFAWGNNADIVAPGDYDGDSKTDIGVAHAAGPDLFWYVRLSGGGIIENLRWGFNTDLMTPGDYDGDGRTDIAVWRPSDGVFYIRGSAGGNIFSQWGQNLDYPPANYNTH